MLDGPTIGKQVFESLVVGVQSHEKFSDVCPGLNAMTLCAGQDRVQDCRPWTRILAADKQPILAADRLVTQRSF